MTFELLGSIKVRASQFDASIKDADAGRDVDHELVFVNYLWRPTLRERGRTSLSGFRQLQDE